MEDREIRKEFLIWEIVHGLYGRGIINTLEDKSFYKNPIPDNLEPLDEGFRHATTFLQHPHVDNGGTHKDPTCLDEYNMIIQEDGTIRVISKWNRPGSERLFAIGFFSNRYTICQDYLGIKRRN